MTNDKSNQERAKEYDQIIAMQRAFMISLFTGQVSVGGKPVRVGIGSELDRKLRLAGIQTEDCVPAPKFKIGDRVTMPPASPRFKPGDLVTTPDGRDWIIDKIEMTEPETRDFHYWLRQVADREYRNTARDYELTLTPETPQSASAILGAFYDTEEPALFDPELVMTRSQRDELMDCLYGNSMDDYEPEIILARIMNLFPKPE